MERCPSIPSESLVMALTQRDSSVIWHPFTQHFIAKEAIPIVRAEGAYLFAQDGRKYLDAISSWWVNLHGHAHPYIVEKIQRQAEKLEHVIFADFTHLAAIELAERLVKILPGAMSKIFYSDNGSTAVEIAIKMALQYWHNKNSLTQKKTVICFNQGYHGDTFGAMSVSDKNEFNRPFWSHLFQVASIDPPFPGKQERSLEQLKAIISSGNVACFLFEPLILGVGGMAIYPAEGLDALLQLCKEHDIITIADEVMTGFGRTSTLFACEQLLHTVDIICLSKGLTGGFLPLGATACRQFIYDAFLSKDPRKALLHGHSYTANPLSCSAALASLDLLLTDSCMRERSVIAEEHSVFCRQWKDHPKLRRCESLGTILALEYASQEGSSYFHSLRDKLYHFFLDQGILLRPFGNTLHVLPPYCIDRADLHEIYLQIIYTLENFS